MRSASQWIERCLWVVGLLALGVWISIWIGAKVHQALGERELDRRISERPAASVPAPHVAPSLPKVVRGDLVGRIDIPRLDISSVIFQGTDDDVLRDGVGHLIGSPLPGENGNIVLAAHRDTFFRPLRYVHNQDKIELVTPAGTRTYQVFSTSIVTPDQTEVLGPTSRPVLTLVTCYPFDWFGHAPKRFIVKAREIDDRGVTSAGAISAVANSPRQAEETPERAADMMETVDHPAPPPKAKPAHPAALHKFKPYVPISAVRPAPIVEPEKPESAEDAAVFAPDPPAGNRILRGLKKLNPRGLINKLAGTP